MRKLLIKATVTTLLINTPVFALNDGFNFDTCSGSGTFEQQINYYNGDKENAITVGEIPAGIEGLKIFLVSDKDVDIRLYAGNDKIVHWPSGLLNGPREQSVEFGGANITYSGYNGVKGKKGHEFIEVTGIISTAMTMKAFGYRAGYATVDYSWTGKEGCDDTQGAGTFKQQIKNQEIVKVGDIPAGIEDLSVSLKSDKDLDIQLYGEDDTAIIAWPGGLLNGGGKQTIEYKNMFIEWSGYNGDGTGKGHEYIKITGKTIELLTMKAFGYQNGEADVVYSWGNNDVPTDYVFDNTDFENILSVPKLAPYTMDLGTKVFNMSIKESTTEFFPGITTKTYGVNADILGQTIRMHDGDHIKIIYHNKLAEATTIHGHGMHVPAIMDGGPINKIQPNTSWTTEYTVDQEASTNWYHPHLMGKTAEHVYMGLAGMIIVDSDESDALNLPKVYGVDDIPLVLQDKRFDANGQIDYSPTTMEIRRGYRSDTMLVNGVIKPHVDIAAKKIRFRLLNGSNARLYRLAFSDNRSFKQIATDNAFLESPVTLNELILTPGERAEIVVDFKDDIDTDVVLKELNSGLDIMKMNVAKKSSVQDDELPQSLTSHTKYSVNDAVRTRKFVLGMSRVNGAMHMSINGKTINMQRIDEVVPVDEIEIWEITNTMGMEHNFHIHATHFYPIERNGSPDNILENEKGYKDVIRVAPNSTVKIILKMTDFVDDVTGYMYHCHFLEHEDDGMMGQFSVTTGNAVINVDGNTGGGMGGGGMGGGGMP